MDVCTAECEKCVHNCVCSIKEHCELITSKISEMCDESEHNCGEFLVNIKCRHFSRIPTIYTGNNFR